MADKSFKASLAGRSIVALVLFVGFYVLVIGVAGALSAAAYFMVRYGRGFYVLAFALSCIAAAGLILWSVVPRPGRFAPPGPLLTPVSDPRLFEEIFRLARELGQQAPREAYLMLDVTAWVSERGGFMGLGSRRIAGLGLGLLQGLTVGEFRAVLAHEFGHFSRGDTKLALLISRTRMTIIKTIQQLPALSALGKTAAVIASVVQRPFVLYGNWYLRVTQAISRRQEYSADELSVATVGRETANSALRRTLMMDTAFQMYFGSVLGPALNAGFLPPFAAGLGQYAAGEAVRDDLLKSLTWHIENVRSQSYDSHPSLGERLQAIAALPAGRAPEPGPPAIVLLENVPERERELFAFLNPEAGPKLRPIAWDEVLAAALVPYWAELAKVHQSDLAGVTPRHLPDRMRGLADWGRLMAGASGPDMLDEQARSYATGFIAVSLASKMIERGWQASYVLGQYTVLRDGDRSWEPFRSVHALAEGEMAVEDWLRLCEEMGISDLELGPPQEAPREEPAPPRETAPAAAPEAAPAPKAPKKGRKLPYYAGLIITGLAVVVLINLLDRPGGPSPSVVSRPPTEARDLGALMSLNGAGLVARVVRTSSSARSYGATVEVLNESAKTFNFIMVRVEFCDYAGRVMRTLMTDAKRDDSIAPGGRRSYTVTGYGDLRFATVRAAVAYSAEVR
jgi:Zn-dependent protease with chaperone function